MTNEERQAETQRKNGLILQALLRHHLTVAGVRKDLDSIQHYTTHPEFQGLEVSDDDIVAFFKSIGVVVPPA